MNSGMTGEYREAVRRLKARRHFSRHAWIFLAVQAGLFVLNLAFWRGYAWAVWPLLGWGVGLLFHAVSAYSPRGTRLNEKQIAEIMKTLKK